MFPASVTNCPGPGSQDVVHPGLNQANWDGWSFSPCAVPKMITEPGLGRKLQGGLSAFSCGHRGHYSQGARNHTFLGEKLSFLV